MDVGGWQRVEGCVSVDFCVGIRRSLSSTVVRDATVELDLLSVSKSYFDL